MVVLSSRRNRSRSRRREARGRGWRRRRRSDGVDSARRRRNCAARHVYSPRRRRRGRKGRHVLSFALARGPRFSGNWRAGRASPRERRNEKKEATSLRWRHVQLLDRFSKSPLRAPFLVLLCASGIKGNGSSGSKSFPSDEERECFPRKERRKGLPWYFDRQKNVKIIAGLYRYRHFTFPWLAHLLASL